MAIRALNLGNTKRVIHPKDKENPTTWIIGALDTRVLGRLQDKATMISVSGGSEDDDADIQVAQNETAFSVVQFGLKGFENYQDEKGEVLFETERRVVVQPYEVLKGDIVASIPQEVLRWLADEIEKLNTMTHDEGK